ncbi:ArsR family transcriptional regulator [Leekyejoonella antrihumi]|uniref:ArsR family transcriptional regulator n=1 Tax=Leekyejoonella antrihumi TaxID=1660198 RepID=A0A563DTM1_9MICO|nr:ArsR family transcriptional regulator [Leekyejoonella antrihumi]
MTQDQLDRLVTAYERGATIYDLADQFKINRSTISRHLKRNGVVMRRQSPSRAEVDHMVQLYESGLSLVRVGKRVGCDAATVRAHLISRGVQTRDSHGRDLI